MEILSTLEKSRRHPKLLKANNPKPFIAYNIVPITYKGNLGEIIN